MKRYGLVGPVTRDFLTHQFRIMFHTNQHELEFLCPGAQVREIPAHIPPEQTLHISQHPQFASVTWPLDRRDFH